MAGTTLSRAGHLLNIRRLSKGLGRAISLLSILYGINILLGLIRDSVLASIFGAGAQLDILLLGLNFVRTGGFHIAISGTNVLIAIYVPLIMSNDVTGMVAFTGRWLRLTLGILLPVAALSVLFSKPLARLLGPGLDADSVASLGLMLALLSLSWIILGCLGVTKAILDSHHRYFHYPIFSGLQVLGVITGVVLAGEGQAVQGVALGFISGGLIGLGIQLRAINRHLPLKGIWRAALDFSRPADGASLLDPARNVGIMLGISYLIMLQGIIERAYLSGLSPGSLSAYSLALSVVGVPSTLLLPALSSVLLPYFSRQNHMHEGRPMHRRYGLGLNHYILLALLFAGVTALFFGGSDLMTRVLFERGRFLAQDAALTADIIKILSLGFVGYAIGIVFRQVLIAGQKYTHILVISIIVLAIEVILLKVLVPLYGPFGVAIEQLLTSAATVALYFGAIKYDIGNTLVIRGRR